MILHGEAAYYARRIIFVGWLLLGLWMLFSDDQTTTIWGVIMIALGIFGIWKFGLRRYPHENHQV